MQEEIKLTQFSKGGGCGCKIAPSVLQQIIPNNGHISYQHLLVGNESNDDAAVYQLNNGTIILSTADFFMPIVDDAFHFGQIAAANALSDIYAMGGTPLMAIAILGWPVDKLPVEVAQQVMQGGKTICEKAGIPLAGGHTIDSSDPIFGLAVTGTVALEHLKKNNGAQPGDLLLLTKPVGTGLLSTALKRGVLQEPHYATLIKQMTTLNNIGEALGKMKGVHAMTDVTGFGILGHATEMAEGSKVSIELHYSRLPKMEGVAHYIQQRTIPGATARNRNSYSANVQFEKDVNEKEALQLLPDPQTNGGLLIAVVEEAVEEVKSLFSTDHLPIIGRCTERREKALYIYP